MTTRQSAVCPTCRGAGVVAPRVCVACGREFSQALRGGGRPAVRCAVCSMIRYAPASIRWRIEDPGVPFRAQCTGVGYDGRRIVFEYGDDQ
jgi:hypothetical protein